MENNIKIIMSPNTQANLSPNILIEDSTLILGMSSYP